jgi:tRNA U34 5-methylaminomethyl-2-thiouridine-forming methyltransferase MnmC
MKLLLTEDGSHTLFSEQFNEIYHSRHGAIQESNHVFIESGLKFLLEPGSPTLVGEEPVKIFEVGFGTGLNAWLTLIEAQKSSQQIYYEAIELHPVPIDLIKELNYTALIESEKYRPPFHSLHLCTWNEMHQISPFFSFKKLHGSMLDLQMTPEKFNLICFDAFAPEYQPEMWTIDVMQKMFDFLLSGGILVSYCAKSLFQRNLKAAGFDVEKLPGPPGKREMIRAHKKC